MSALRNLVKVVAGTGIGAGIGAAMVKLMERDDQQPTDMSANIMVTEKPGRESLRERLDRAKAAGDAAAAAKEAELRAYFRVKVNDPNAMTGNPTLKPADD